METLLQNPLIMGRFENNTTFDVNLTIQSSMVLHLRPGETSASIPITLSGLMAMELNIHDNDGDNLSNPTLIWQATLEKLPIIFQQANRFFEWEPVSVNESGMSVYHFNLETDGGSLVIIGTVELVEEDLVQEKAHA